MTVVIGIGTFFILPRDPASASFLSNDERDSVVHALARDSQFQEEKDELSWSACAAALKAPQMWFVFIQFFSSGGMASPFLVVCVRIAIVC